MIRRQVQGEHHGAISGCWRINIFTNCRSSLTSQRTLGDTENVNKLMDLDVSSDWT